MNEREEWLLSMYDHATNVEGSKRPAGFPPNESEYMEAVELDRARRQAAELMKYGTIEQGPTGFMADYIRPMMDSLEQKHGGGSPESGVSTADLINLGMLGMGMGSRVSGSSPKGAKPSKPEPRRTRVVQEGKKTTPSDADRRGGVGPDWERLPDGRPANGNLQSSTGTANGHTKRVPGMEVERRAELQEYMERLMAGMGKYFPPGQ